jgi:hypothetical protein
MQTTYGAAASGLAGLIATTHPHNCDTRALATKKLVEITAGTTDGTYTITIDGVLKATFAASSNTAAQIITDLLADLNAASGNYVASAGSTTAKLLIEQRDNSETPITVAISTVASYTAVTLVDQAIELLPGLGVVRDDRASVTGKQCRLPRVSGDIAAGIFLGIAALETNKEINGGLGYANGSPIPILTMGDIWLQVEGTVTEGQNLFCRYASGAGGTQLGAFRADADTSTAGAVPGLYTKQARTGAGLVLARFLP